MWVNMVVWRGWVWWPVFMWWHGMSGVGASGSRENGSETWFSWGCWTVSSKGEEVPKIPMGSPCGR